VHVRSDTDAVRNGTADFAGVDNAAADPFRDELVSLLVMTANGQADARGSCRATR
jgi:hypothetical protein